MNKYDFKDTLLEEINRYKELTKQYQMQSLANKFQQLYNDIMQDYYSFVVVGEFSTGKSTFLNALIENAILPTGITPTTATINVIKYGKEYKATIIYTDGKESTNTNKNILKEFIAKNIKDAEQINRIEMSQPIEFLKDQIVLVDTPGLNDINELRSDITYQYIPRADVVFFLLDCRAPIRQTEYEFITNTLLSNGLDKIIYIANFADEVDEDELDTIIEKMRRNIRQGTNVNEVEIIPFSALEAIDAIVDNDEELYEISGMPIVKEKMKKLCNSGSRMQEKKKRFETRLFLLKEEFHALLQQKKVLLEKSNEELQQYNLQLKNWYDTKQVFLDNLKEYKDDRIHEFQKMAKISIETFFEDLEEEVHERIDVYTGNQVQVFFETEIPIIIKRKMKNWIERYTPHIHELIGKLEIAIAEILTQMFKEKISVNSFRRQSIIANAKVIELQSGEKADPFLTSGLIVGGASTLLLALGGTMFLPILGMVGLPYLQKNIQKKQLESLKPQMKIDVSSKLLEVKFQFIDEVCNYIGKSANEVYEQSLQLFYEQISEQELLLKEQIESNKNASNNNKQEVLKITKLLEERKLLTI